MISTLIIACLSAHSTFGSADIFESLRRVHTISRPGTCQDHEQFPYTFQCARTRRCISDAQMWNNVYDCCGEGNEANCEDTSDEDRVRVVTQESCRAYLSSEYCAKDPRACANERLPSKFAFEKGLVMQCAKTGRCLLAKYHPHAGVDHITFQPNMRCECCGDNVSCDECDDHSDEDACMASAWLAPQDNRFACDTSRSCLPWARINDDKLDCPYDCNEPPHSEECKKKLVERLSKNTHEICEQFEKKGTDHIKCTMKAGPATGIPVCQPFVKVRDGTIDCEDGSDEDHSLHRDCTEAEFAEHCERVKADTCVMVGGKNAHCRCSPHNDKCVRAMRASIKQRNNIERTKK